MMGGVFSLQVLYNHHGVIVKKLEKYVYHEDSNSSFISFVSSGSLNIFERVSPKDLYYREFGLNFVFDILQLS